MIGGIGDPLGINRMLMGSEGMQANRALQALGLPETFANQVGAMIDMGNQDWAGYQRNMMDLTSGMSTSQMDKLFGSGLPPSQFVPRPHVGLPKGRALWGNQFHTPFGTHDISREKLGGKGFFGKMVGRSMERAILTNPAFKARMERILGGRIIPDGRADGKITVHRFRPNFSGVPFNNQIANNPMLSGLYAGLARMEGNVKNLMNNLMGGAQGAAKSGGSGGANQTSGAGFKDPESNQIASDMGLSSPMSFEDILFVLMLKYAKKKEKEILDKMKELNRTDGKDGGGGGRRRGYGGGLLGGIGKIAGGAIGGMYGGPMGAQLGSSLGGAAGNAIGGGGGAGGGGGGGGGYDPLDAKQSDATKQAMMQKMMNDLQKVYTLLSNVMKSMHDMQMASVRNIR